LEERIYRVLVKRGGAPLSEIVTCVEVSAKAARQALGGLEANGLISRSPVGRLRFVPAPPEMAVDVLVRRRQEEVAEARLAAIELQKTFRQAREKGSPPDVVEVVTGREAIIQRFVQLQRSARRELLGFARPPFVGSKGPNDVERELLSRGVRYRIAYDREVLESAGIDGLRGCIAAGEEARTYPNLPMKLAICDDRQAMIPLRVDDPGSEDVLIVHTSPLLEALRMLFEAVWERAVPIGPPGSLEADRVSGSQQDRDLLMLLAGGLKDQAISRQLGVSLRTVQRRIRGLMDKLGAETRFQAGLQARERNWVGPAE
jgi:sugar-specific transcriptional regulator TrmB/DNA-binding CsgD family transcriptional regulator